MEQKPITTEMIQLAEKVAGDRCRKPDELPAMAAAKGVLYAILVFAVFELLNGWLDEWWAEGITIGLCGLISFLDCRQKWNFHTSVYQHALDRLRQ